MLSYAELEKAGKKPVFLTEQTDMFPAEPRTAKPRRKAKRQTGDAAKRASTAAKAQAQARTEKAERARSAAGKKREERGAERAEQYSGIFGALARLWHGED